MPLPNFDELFSAANESSSPVVVVAAGGGDATVLQSLDIARRRGWVSPILTGDTEQIRELASQVDIDLDGFEILEDESNSAKVAVEQVRSGRAQMLMKGQISTPFFMKAVLNKDTGLRSGKTIAQVVLMEVAKDSRSFLMTDTGVSVEPNLKQKAELIEHVVRIAKALGIELPRIAIMSATEKETGAMPDTLDAVELSRQAGTGEYGECVVQGPLSFDLAYAMDAGVKKGLVGDVTGAADAMVFPNLLSANLTVKGIMYTADCRFGGVLAGTTAPVVFMSRADSVETRLNSIAYAMSLVE